MNLTVLCVTEGYPHARRFLEEHADLADTLGARLVIGADGPAAFDMTRGVGDSVVLVQSEGSMESILDELLEHCDPGHVLRIDDDEACSPAMVEWLLDRAYEAHDHWSFATASLFPDPDHYIVSPPLWPDPHSRLSIREKSGGRPVLHMPSPHGPGQLAPVVLEHHKFIVRPLEERRARVLRSEKECGSSPYFRIFAVPEDYDVEIAPYVRDAAAVTA